MRITIVTGFFLPVPAVRGGAIEKIWHGLARLFAAQGHEVTFVSRSWPGMPESGMEEGVRHIRRPGFDHTKNLPMNLLLDALWGVRVSWALPEADIVICNTITLPIWLHAVKPSAGKVAVMIGRTPKGQVGFYRGVARIYVLSSAIAALIPEGIFRSRTRVVGCPIDWPLLSRACAPKGTTATLGFVGRIHPEKGIELLLRAACLLAERTDLPAWRIRLVGPVDIASGGGGHGWLDPLKREYSRKLGDRIEWLPPEFQPEALARLYGSMDIFCYPSLAEKGETFGVAAAEAMAAGCATVVSALGCFNDFVRNGETGLVFDHAGENPQQLLADCLGSLIADPLFRRELASRGQREARRFDFPEVAERILNDLAVLTGQPAQKRG